MKDIRNKINQARLKLNEAAKDLKGTKHEKFCVHAANKVARLQREIEQIIFKQDKPLF